MRLWSLVARWHSYYSFIKKEIVIFTIAKPLKYKSYSIISIGGGSGQMTIYEASLKYLCCFFSKVLY
jgi:hypothetical protein